MVSVGEGIVYVTPAKLKRAASFTIVRRKAEFELLCVPRQSDAPRQCSHRKSCTAAASAMTKGNFGPFMTTGLPSTRAESCRSLQARARMPHRWEPTFRYSQIGNSFCSAEGGSEPMLPKFCSAANRSFLSAPYKWRCHSKFSLQARGPDASKQRPSFHLSMQAPSASWIFATSNAPVMNVDVFSRMTLENVDGKFFALFVCHSHP